MIEEPGWFSGRKELAEARARPRPEQADIICDLEQAGGDRTERSMREYDSIVSRQRLELVIGGNKGQAGQAGDLHSNELGELRLGIEPGADRGPALRQWVKFLQGSIDSSRSKVTCAAYPENSCPRVSGVASCPCVRPILMMPPNSFDFCSRACCKLARAGISR